MSEEYIEDSELVLKLLDINENLINYMHNILISTNYENKMLLDCDTKIMKISNDFNKKLKSDYNKVLQDNVRLRNEILFLNNDKDYLIKKCDEYNKIKELYYYVIDRNVKLINERIISNNKLFLETIKNDILKNENKELIDELNSVKDEYRCTICYENSKKIVIEPCNHFCCCEDCLEMIDKCPICRGEIKKIIKIY